MKKKIGFALSLALIIGMVIATAGTATAGIPGCRGTYGDYWECHHGMPR